MRSRPETFWIGGSRSFACSLSSDLKKAWLQRPDCEQQGEDGVEYQIEVEARWDDRNAPHLRLVLSIDDGRGWRAFAPLTDSFIVAPDGSFVGEE